MTFGKKILQGCPPVWVFVLSIVWNGVSASAQDLKTQNVVLITIDGLRWQEVFTGAEEDLLRFADDTKAARDKYWRKTPQERREVLMPFLWSKVAKDGQIFGNRNEGSVSQITNKTKISYPGYSEILTGFADPKIDSNDLILNENSTVLEWLHRKPEFDGKVAAYHSWKGLAFIINRQRCDFPVMAGWEPVPEEHPNARQQEINDLIAKNPPGQIDFVAFQAAREHLLRHQPRLFYVGFSEPDMAHYIQYDQVLGFVHEADDYIRQLWEVTQSLDHYRDKTTFIITTDHGRGSGLEDWRQHDPETVGAEYMWMAFLGPDTPALGERKQCHRVTQDQIAATLAAFLDQDYRAEVSRAGKVIPDVLPPAK
ncbi:alkaline phosphatase family protein [Planctomicrobium sp. SH661]|uniref:alkaline phosphatase family protein n=1 Tax=Planctomicrobium sp. SH661 TaxID=3448124 RepID=UPI003F5BB595